MKNKNINRRSFLKTVTATGLGSFIISKDAIAEDKKAKIIDPNAPTKPKLPQVPRRKLGKTGAEVSSLALGGGINFLENQLLLKKSLDWGVNYWDTADCYSGGKSELGIGKFFGKFPKRRKEIFLVTKSDKRDSAGIQGLLERSLERMKTDYIDLYFLHGVKSPDDFTDDVKAWAEKAKKSGKIKLFGFSTHSNMAECLTTASELGWIDAIMPRYNFRFMNDDEMKKAVELCHKAGIGITAMKTQAYKEESETEKQLSAHFMQKGYTEHQAKIKAVWQDPRIASICSAMPNVAILVANVAAALDKTKLAASDMQALGKYAQATCSGYCTGCSGICQQACPEMPYISDIMRHMMYYNNYSQRDEARELFAQLPVSPKEMLNADYAIAEARCPQGMPIAKLMAEAVKKLA
jgi:uncharacterized protein